MSQLNGKESPCRWVAAAGKTSTEPATAERVSRSQTIGALFCERMQSKTNLHGAQSPSDAVI